MPRCPSCGKLLSSEDAVLRHMNQPASRCFGWTDNLVQIGELLEAEENHSSQPPQAGHLQAAHRHPSADWNQPDEMNVDLPDGPCGGTVEEFPGAAAIFAHQQNSFLDRFDRDQFSNERGSNLYYPFASRADWEFGLWLTRSGLSMAAVDSLLSLELVRFSITRCICGAKKSSGQEPPALIFDGSAVAGPYRAAS